uniref:BTB domain-containing protein n=1 Tax=Panagrolaimus superbus TaxID=310955 RepID=A0A914Z9M1_9BILA
MDDKLKNFYALHMEKYEIFKAQNPETGDFDVVFEIEGKKLYAHKSKLCEVSNTFNSMLSERWTTPNEPINIQKYTFDDFKTFVTFIYSGEFEFDSNKISTMVDIAEFYNVKVFKNVCQNILLKTEWNLINVFPMLNLANKYFMEDLKKSLLDFISKNLPLFHTSDAFDDLSHSLFYEIVKSIQNTVRQEELFEMVFKRSEKQALEKQKSDKNLNLNEAIKEELSVFLPFIKFHLMNLEFIMIFVVSKSFFLFSGNELSNMLLKSRNVVTITDKNGKMMKGVLNCDNNEKISHMIQAKKNEIATSGFYWTLDKSFKPSSKLVKNPSIKWYLVFCVNHKYDLYYLVIRQIDTIEMGDIILAEMIAEDGFELKNCKIV